MVVREAVERIYFIKASTFIAKEFNKVWFRTDRMYNPYRSHSKSEIIVCISSVVELGSTTLHSLQISTFGSYKIESSEDEALQCVFASR